MKPLQTEKIYELIINEINDLIDESHLHVGDRIPSEREIAARLSVSRSSVRQAISVLVTKGVLTVKQVGGTYLAVGAFNEKFTLAQQLSTSLAENQISPLEIAEMRLFIECESARLCAINATDNIIIRLQSILYRAYNFNEKTDSLFKINNDLHFTIAEGASNRVLLLIMRSILELMSANMWEWAKKKNMKKDAKMLETHREQHRRIVEAIIAHNPEEAEACMRDHLSDITHEMNILFNESIQHK